MSKPTKVFGLVRLTVAADFLGVKQPTLRLPYHRTNPLFSACFALLLMLHSIIAIARLEV